MGKRSTFERVPRDFYPTPLAAVLPLLPYLPAGTRFVEPCAGDGRLIRHLEAHGHICTGAIDIDPRGPGIATADALTTAWPVQSVDMIITNPPWRRDVLHPLIEHLSDQATTWLLLDGDWAHTRQAAPYMARCRRIVAIGRVKWIEGSKFTGKENACWYEFDRAQAGLGSVFFARAA